MKTPRTSKLPPFFTHMLGSFPRPRVVLDLFTRTGEFTHERHTQILDDLVRFAIRTQGLTGLDIVTDGRWRGPHLLDIFMRRVGGFQRISQADGSSLDVIVERMNPTGSVFKADADFLVNNTARLTKFTIPSPMGLALDSWREDRSKAAYPTRQAFMEHLVAILSAEVHALVTAGIDIIEIHDPALLRLCDPKSRDAWAHLGTAAGNPDSLVPAALAAINKLSDSARDNAEIHLHCCAGRVPKGAGPLDYKPLLVRLNEARIDCVNLAFATRPEAVADLQLLPPHMSVGMGVLDARPGRAGTAQEIQALAEAAAKIVPPGRIGLAPDCGFGGNAGGAAALDEAYDKLRLLTATAKALRTR
jgi:5-methyltetrahydropteroyltriglutamate--homocysteine methyltransferase